MPYLLKRGNAYYFNRRAPSPLVAGQTFRLGELTVTVGKNSYIRFPLKTTDRKTAGIRARKYAHLVDKAVEDLAGPIDPPASQPEFADHSPPSALEIEHAAGTMRAMLLAADEHTLNASIAAVMAGEDEIREPDRYTWSALDLPPLTVAGQAELIQRLSQLANFYLYITCKKSLQRVGPELLPFANEFRRFVGELESRAAGKLVPTPALPDTPAALWSWQKALDYYFEQRIAAPKTRLIYRQAWLSLAGHVNAAPADLTLAQVVDWRDNVLRKKVALVTAKNRLGHAAAIWRESRTAGHIPRGTPDPFDGLTVKVAKSKGSSRVQFTLAELKAIFAAEPPQTARAVSVHAGYWVPILAAYYGARLEEVTGIEVADLVDTPSGLAFWIRPNGTRNIKGGDPGARLLPLHPTVGDLGFEAYCEAARVAKVTRLFPSIARSQSFGELFVDHVKKLIRPAPGRLVGMHCFRHGWETAKRNADPNFDYSVGRYIAGRSIDTGSAAAYGSEAGLPKIVAELSKIRFGVTHRPAPEVTPAMLKAQEARSIESLQVGRQRRRSDQPAPSLKTGSR